MKNQRNTNDKYSRLLVNFLKLIKSKSRQETLDKVQETYQEFIVFEILELTEKNMFEFS